MPYDFCEGRTCIAGTLKKGLFEIRKNSKIAKDIFLMKLRGDTSAVTAPGQFINIALNGFYLRRPISVCDCNDGLLTIIYKVQGKGTEYLKGLEKGRHLDILTGLGNGYNTANSGDIPLLIGGGVGVPPLYYLAKKLIAEHKKPIAILGFNTGEDVFAAEEFRQLGITTLITTVDGSTGIKGFVTDAMKEVKDYTYIYTCGPEPMLKAVYNESVTSGEFSFEERMGCGFGACMGCSCKTKYGNKRICKDGPVLKKEEIIW